MAGNRAGEGVEKVVGRRVRAVPRSSSVGWRALVDALAGAREGIRTGRQRRVAQLAGAKSDVVAKGASNARPAVHASLGGAVGSVDEEANEP